MRQLVFGGPPKSKMSHFQTENLDLQTLDPKFDLALDPKVLKLGDSFFGTFQGGGGGWIS